MTNPPGIETGTNHTLNLEHTTDQLLGLRLLILRETRGIDLEQFAQRANLPPHSIAESESGAMPIPLSRVKRYAAALSMTPMDLLEALQVTTDAPWERPMAPTTQEPTTTSSRSSRSMKPHKRSASTRARSPARSPRASSARSPSGGGSSSPGTSSPATSPRGGTTKEEE